MSFHVPKSQNRRVVIVGGGFGGMTLANGLKKSDFQIVLIDRNNYHQFPPLIYQVASSGLEPSSISFPFRKLFQKRKNLYFRMAEVESVDPKHRTLHTSIGTIEYDFLIFAAGATTNFFGNETIAQGAMPMKTVGEAMALRNSLLTNLERALASSAQERDELLNIVITGGGATGVEIAGVLSEMKRFVLPRDYPDLKPDSMRIHLIEAGDRLLAGMSQKSSDKALDFLRGMGVDVHLNCKVSDYRENKVILEGGKSIPSQMFIWVSGVKATPIGGIPQEVIGRGGRVRVDAYNRVSGMEHVFAIGDQCILEGDPDYPNGHPQLAQVAIQQGRNLAANLCHFEEDLELKPFRYRNLGVMATIGRNRAVAEIGRLKFTGWFAWILWLTVHLRSILGVKNKIIVLLNWIWSYLTYDQSLRLILRAAVKSKSAENADDEKPHET